jgi:hypothetical protein
MKVHISTKPILPSATRPAPAHRKGETTAAEYANPVTLFSIQRNPSNMPAFRDTEIPAREPLLGLREGLETLVKEGTVVASAVQDGSKNGVVSYRFERVD